MTKIKLISEEQAYGTTLEFYKMLKSRLVKFQMYTRYMVIQERR